MASIKISATNLTEPITLDCGSTGVQLNETTATPFHIAVPTPDDAIAYTGLKIEITDVDYWVCTKTAKSAINVFRSLITDITLTLAESSFVAPDYLCFTSTRTNTIQMIYKGEESRPNLQYSTNLRTWNNMDKPIHKHYS